jgi:hypothetical protein
MHTGTSMRPIAKRGMRNFTPGQIQLQGIVVCGSVQAVQSGRYQNHIATFKMYPAKILIVGNHSCLRDHRKATKHLLDASQKLHVIRLQLQDYFRMPGQMNHDEAQEIHHRIKARQQQERDQT